MVPEFGTPAVSPWRQRANLDPLSAEIELVDRLGVCAGRQQPRAPKRTQRFRQQSVSNFAWRIARVDQADRLIVGVFIDVAMFFHNELGRLGDQCVGCRIKLP
jgi:hypothetical protein